MPKDLYQTLGVARDASQDDIRKAYRRLAKSHHPDLNPGVAGAEDRFKDVSNAYDILSDAEKRRRYDSGEIDASGAERPAQPYYRDFASQPGPDFAYQSSAGFADFDDASDLFAELLKQRARRPGPDRRYQLEVDFLEAANGAVKRLTLPDGGTLDLTIPPGVEHGQVLRLRGKGGASPGGGEPGDALVEVAVKPHPLFRRVGDDVHLELPISLTEAVLGARVPTPTPSGQVILTVPKGANTGVVLRLKGKGIARRGGRGDALVTLKVMLPSKPDEALETFLSTWEPLIHEDPRREMPS